MPVSQDELVQAGVTKGLISDEDLPQLRLQARRDGRRLVDAAAYAGRFPVSTLYRALAEERGLPFVDFGQGTLQQELAKRIPEAILRARPALPFELAGGELVIATADPEDSVTIDSVRRLMGQSLPLAITDPDSLRMAADSILGSGSLPKTGTCELGGPLIDTVSMTNQILDEAYLSRASDIHLETMPAGMRIRLRVDGFLQTFRMGLDAGTAASIISRLKILAGLDISEHRAPQDGRFTYEPKGPDKVQIDIRMATLPTRWGERVTMRLLDGDGERLTLENLGMGASDRERFQRVIQQPQGMVLLTGPTGSGKTSTLYAALDEINQPHRNIMTVENPIEYMIPGISQIQIGATDKLTFSSALRSLVRHDPDVIMVGEIRDFETADIAMKAAMTGHLIFSTLHTNSAPDAVTRLVDMGCERYLVASTITAVIAQRLVRRLCEQCKRPRVAEPEEARLLGVDDREVTIYDPLGCARCHGRGYSGRIGIFETMWMNEETRRLISQGATEAELRASIDDLTALRGDAIAKVINGVTSIDDVLKATVSEF